MASLDNKILNVLKTRESWEKYRQYVPEESLSVISRRTLNYVDQYWSKYEKETEFDWEYFKKWLGHVASKDTHVEAMQQICTVNAGVTSTDDAVDVLNTAVERDVIERILPEFESNTLDTTKIRSLLDELDGFKTRDTSVLKNVVSTDIEEVLADSCVSEGGLPFPLEILRSSVGPLRPGDTVIVPARPEVGKTTFLVHTISHMILNTENTSGLIVSNEEDGNRVMLRLYQSVLNRTTKEILDDPVRAKSDYRDALGGDSDRIQVVHSSELHRKDVEQILQSRDFSVLGFNLLSKLNGFRRKFSQNDVDVYAAQGLWMRELANRHSCATITGWQAGSEAHGVAWIEQHHLYQSKTGLLGEADVVLGIGQRHDPSIPDNLRYIHLSKNKLAGDSSTIESLRHGYFDGVYIDAERGRFYEK